MKTKKQINRLRKLNYDLNLYEMETKKRLRKKILNEMVIGTDINNILDITSELWLLNDMQELKDEYAELSYEELFNIIEKKYYKYKKKLIKELKED